MIGVGAGSGLARVRVARDLVVIATGLGLIVFGVVAGGDRQVFTLGGLLVVVCGFGLRGHLRRGRGRVQVWSRGTRVVLSVIGLVLGLWALSWGAAALGVSSETATGTATDCSWFEGQSGIRHSSAGYYGCTVSVTWPDGTSGTRQVQLPTGDGTRATLLKPTGLVSHIVSTDVSASWQDGVAYAAVGFVLVGQALLSIVILLAGRDRSRASTRADGVRP